MMIQFIVNLIIVVIAAVDAGDEKPQETYYQLMRVEPTASEKELRKAYRKLAMEHHPDKAKSHLDRQLKHERFVRLANVYEVLSETTLRGRYDWLLTQGKFDYDPSLDWEHFDTEHGFQTPVDTEWGRMSFEDAQRMYARAEWEATKETYVLVGCFLAAVAAGLVPVFMTYFKKQKTKGRKKEAKSQVKEEQRVLAQMRVEQEKEHKDVECEQRRARAELRTAQAAQKADQNDEDDNNDGDGEKKNKIKNDGDGDSGVIKCDACKKRFKSEKQMDNHVNSKKHKEAVKKAGGGRKGGAKAAAKAALAAMDDMNESELEDALKKKDKKNKKKDKKKQQLRNLLAEQDAGVVQDAATPPVQATSAKAPNTAKAPKKSRRNAATKEENKRKKKAGKADAEDE